MLRMGQDEIGGRADALAAALNKSGWTARVIDGMSTVGGGSAPGSELPTRLVELTRDGMTADQIEQYLRTLDPPIVARIQADRVVIDLRTVAVADEALLVTLLRTTT
jgi:L-seryl-tRNA(Ser) seleniumtransferase